ncbi:hypothetical protein F5Y14DRAFT_452357 [Nemania sp. NC0429]|nr:hypothetical protein F5Y14DRAFT_452357 [Nemania sp. NC0429]
MLASRVGEACVFALATLGVCHLVVADINLNAANAVAAACKTKAKHGTFAADAMVFNIASAESIDSAVASAFKVLQRIDYFIHAVGFGNMMNIHVAGTFLAARAVSNAMRSQDPIAISNQAPGRGLTRRCIVIIGSASAFVATPSMIQYTTPKHAVLGLTKNAALDNAAHAIRANRVCSAWVDTPMIRKAMTDIPELAKMIQSSLPTSREDHNG